MRHELGSDGEPGVRFSRESGVLHPSVPQDIGARSQQQRILAAIAESCAEKSFARTTIADIVQRAGISRATFYKHFANKHECFEAAVFRFVDDLEAAAIEAQVGAERGLEALERSAAAVLEGLAANPEQAKLALIEAPSVDPLIVGRYRELAVGVLESQLGSVGAGKPAGADPRIAFGRAQVLLAEYLATDRAASLPDLLPEIVYVALLPFVGQDEALVHAKLSG